MQSAGVSAAGTVAESVRQLNHATIAGRGYACAADVDATVAQLQLAAGRLGQALSQAESWLTAAQARGALGHDGEEDPDRVLLRLRVSFGRAVSTADQLERDLNEVHSDTSHLTGRRSAQRVAVSDR